MPLPASLPRTFRRRRCIVAVPNAAFVGLLSFTGTVSFGSSVVSLVTETAMGRLLSPAAKVSVPVGRPCSSFPTWPSPYPHTPSIVTHLSFTALSVTVNVNVDDPLSPSSMLGGETDAADRTATATPVSNVS